MKEMIRRYVERCAEKKGDLVKNYMHPEDVQTWDQIIASLGKREGLSEK